MTTGQRPAALIKTDHPVLVTGGGGFLGKAIVQQLIESDLSVRSFSRRPHGALTQMGVEQIQGDLGHKDAVRNAGRFLKEADVDAVKLEGGTRVVSRIRAIVEAGIVVIGHIGLTPQSSGALGGHKAQGRTADQAALVVADALAVQEAGAHMLLVEAVPPEVAQYIAQTLTIPVFSIGAGKECDGQLLIVSDLIGQFQAFTPKFVKRYCDVATLITDAMKAYCKDVKEGSFPEDQHCYHMLAGEKERFYAQMQERTKG